MTPNDNSQDRELLERYRQASDTDLRAPSAAVRAAIFDEARRVAASLSASDVKSEPAPRPFGWKITAWGTAAAALLAALVIAPRLGNEAPPTHVASVSSPAVPFNQAAKKIESAEPSAEPHPVVPVMPVPPPNLESIAPQVLADAPTLRRAVPAPPPVHVPEQSVEVTALARSTQSAAPELQRSQLNSFAQAKNVNPNFTAGSDSMQRSANAFTPLLATAAAGGDVAMTTQLLDQGAAINEPDASGRTPLMLAIGQHQVDVVRLLLDRGADPNAADQHGTSPLQLAQQGNLDDIAALLIKAGAH